MNISRDEARAALESVDEASTGVAQLRHYADAAPYLILWGAIWAGANIVTDVRPRLGAFAWLIGMAVGLAGTVIFSVRIAMRERRRVASALNAKTMARRFTTLGIVMFAYFPAMFLVLGPMSGRQQNAFISLFWAFTYMAAGAWLGVRLTIIGAVTAAGILCGFLFIEQHFALWMALFGGGSLIAAGLWLRNA